MEVGKNLKNFTLHSEPNSTDPSTVEVIRIEIVRINDSPFHKKLNLVPGAKEFTDQEIADLWTETLGHDLSLVNIIDQYRSATGIFTFYT